LTGRCERRKFDRFAMPRPAAPRVTFPAFAKTFHARLEGLGYVPVADRFPVAAIELAKLDFKAVVKPSTGRSFVIAVTRGDRLAREQLRYLSDMYYNALALERNEIKINPTLIRGIC